MQNTLYLFHTTHDEFNAEGIKNICNKELLRAEKYKDKHRKQTYLLGRLLLMESLKFLIGDSAYQIEYSKYGKPILISPDNLAFNITHTGNHLFLAVCEKSNVGIDCETYKTNIDYNGISKRLFSESEHLLIVNSKTPYTTFYYYWTRYEAQIKYHGTSLFRSTPKLTNQVKLNSYIIESIFLSILTDINISKVDFYQCYSNRFNESHNLEKLQDS